MSYPGVSPEDMAQQEIPEVFRANPGVKVAQTVPTAHPHYGGGSWSAPREFDFQTPSGAWCRVRKISPEDALTMGLINHLDIFSPELLRDAAGAQRKPADVEKAVLSKLAASGDSGSFFDTIKAIVLRAVVKPTMVEHEGTEETPLPEGTYSIANVGTKDRMAIFYAAIGEDMQKIQQFREGPESGVGSMESVESV